MTPGLSTMTLRPFWQFCFSCPLYLVPNNFGVIARMKKNLLADVLIKAAFEVLEEVRECSEIQPFLNNLPYECFTSTELNSIEVVIGISYPVLV